MWWAEAPMAMAVGTVAAAMASDPGISRAATGDSLISTTIATGRVGQLAVVDRMAGRVLVAQDCPQVRASTMAGHTIVIRTLRAMNMVDGYDL